MRRRFSVLRKALKYNDGVAAPGSALEQFKNVRTGATKVNYTRDPGSNPGTLETLILYPFATAAGEQYITSISQRSKAALSTIGGAALYNHLDSGIGAEDNPGYVPAKAIVNKSGTGTTEPISKITGLPYKKETGSASYTVPFGSEATLTPLKTVTTAIRLAITNINEEYSVSFKPETWRL